MRCCHKPLACRVDVLSIWPRQSLEAHVTVLEESVADLENDMANTESANILQDQRLNIIETDVSDNENDIEGSCFRFSIFS